MVLCSALVVFWGWLSEHLVLMGTGSSILILVLAAKWKMLQPIQCPGTTLSNGRAEKPRSGNFFSSIQSKKPAATMALCFALLCPGFFQTAVIYMHKYQACRLLHALIAFVWQRKRREKRTEHLLCQSLKMNGCVAMAIIFFLVLLDHCPL